MEYRGERRFLQRTKFFLVLLILLLAPFSYLEAGAPNGRAKGGPISQPYSMLFFAGSRNGASQDVNSSVISGLSYGEGPTEPSLSSTLDGSIFKQSSPLTIASADNARLETATYVVKSGDNPWLIAASFGITINTLLWANSLAEDEYIKPGDELLVLPVSGVRYKAKAGDTILSIAKKFKGDLQKILDFNHLGPDGSIVEGDYLIIPDGEMPRPLGYARGYAPRYAQYLQNLDDYFIHPTAGAGYKSRGIHGHNAVDIAGPCWSPIYAAAAGSVAVSDSYGWNGGYGKYVKVSHPNDTQTIYAHNIQNEVSSGQTVKQGELLAYMGSTGRSTGCHVHWEVYGALNPLR